MREKNQRKIVQFFFLYSCSLYLSTIAILCTSSFVEWTKKKKYTHAQCDSVTKSHTQNALNWMASICRRVQCERNRYTHTDTRTKLIVYWFPAAAATCINSVRYLSKQEPNGNRLATNITAVRTLHEFRNVHIDFGVYRLIFCHKRTHSIVSNWRKWYAHKRTRERDRKTEWYMTNVNCCLPIDEFRKSLRGNDKRPRNMFHAQIVDKMKGMFLHCTMNYCTHMTSDSHSVHNNTHWMDRQFQKDPNYRWLRHLFFTFTINCCYCFFPSFYSGLQSCNWFNTTINQVPVISQIQNRKLYLVQRNLITSNWWLPKRIFAIKHWTVWNQGSGNLIFQQYFLFYSDTISFFLFETIWSLFIYLIWVNFDLIVFLMKLTNHFIHSSQFFLNTIVNFSVLVVENWINSNRSIFILFSKKILFIYNLQ